jgi:hypothetical protein
MGLRFGISPENILCKENFFYASFVVVDKVAAATHF